MVLPLIAAGATGAALNTGKGKNFLKNWANRLINAAPATVGAGVGNRFGGPIGGVVGSVLGGALATKEAQEARKDQSGFFPELGLSEGLGAIWKAGADARKDQSGFFPELGLSEMAGKTFGLDRSNSQDSDSQRALAGAGAAGAGVGSAAARAANFLNPLSAGPAVGRAALATAVPSSNDPFSVYGDWTSKTSNSPAARAGFDESERFGQQLRHQQWLKDKGRNYDRNFDSWLR